MSLVKEVTVDIQNTYIRWQCVQYVCTYIGYVLARVAFRFQTKLYFTDVQLEMLQVVLYNQLRAELSTK